MDPRLPSSKRAVTSASSSGPIRRLLDLLLYDRGVRFAAGLAVVVAIPVAVLFYFQFRSLDDLEETSAIVLRQLSRDTADSVGREVEELLKRPHIDLLLRPGQQSRLSPPDFPWLDTVFAEGMAANPFIEELWLWSENADGHEDAFYVFDRANLTRPATGEDRRFYESPARHAQIVPAARTLGEQRRAIVAFPMEVDGRKKYIQLQLGFQGPNRERVQRLLGFMVDAEELKQSFFPSVIRKRLAGVQQPVGFPPLDLYLADGDGQTITASGPIPPDTVFVDERTFPLVFFDRELLEYAAPYEASRETWRVRTSYGVRTIPEIVTASTRPQMALMIVMALVMAGGVFLVASAAAREVRLAELKSNFVASVSHDLKTPLALIQLFAETLELGRVRTAERAQDYYRIINSEARKLTRLIENLLDFSRMEAGLRPYRAAPADIGEVTREVVDAMTSQFDQAQFTVRLEIEPDLPPVKVDEGAVVQAIENLLANAIKYSGDARRDRRSRRTRQQPRLRQREGSRRRDFTPRPEADFPKVLSRRPGPRRRTAGLRPRPRDCRPHDARPRRLRARRERTRTWQHVHVALPRPRGRAPGGPRAGPGDAGEGEHDETDSGDRGRTADVARSA